FAIALVREDDRREVFEINLMNDSGIGRNDAEVLESRLAPTQKTVALAITLEFEKRVRAERVLRAKLIDLHRMIDDQIDGDQRICKLRVGVQIAQGVAHRSEIDHAGNTGKILQKHAGWHEADFARRRLHIPFRDILDVGLFNVLAVLVPQQIFEQNANRI